MEERIFHYTKGIHMKKILTQKIIKLSKGFKDCGEFSCVSVTTNPVFVKDILPAEPVDPNITLDSVAKNGIIKLSDMPKYQKITDMRVATVSSRGFYRIEVSSDLELLNWNEFRNYCKSQGRINEKYFNSLEKILYENGSLYDVLFSLKPIFMDNWLNIEKRDVETGDWSKLTTNDVFHILMMEDVKLIELKPIYPSMQILEVFNN